MTEPPKQNRVTPFGEIVARPEKWMFTGNRGGVLHDQNHRIVRHFDNRRWIICDLQFKDRKAQIMAPGQYTHLFFFDEAAALAAGHRPCFECRRPRATEFYKAWLDSFEPEDGPSASLDILDKTLHAERIDLVPGRRQGTQKVHQATPSQLPDGAYIVLHRLPHLVWQSLAHVWSPSGYGKPVPLPSDTPLTVLTPPSTLAALRGGYRPVVHPSVSD